MSGTAQHRIACDAQGARGGAVPPLGVVMPVRNAERYLDESVGSILAQTFGDFEFVILDDASTDGSARVLREWAGRDSRIRLHHSPRALGLSESSNAVVRLSRAHVIARMDADDVSHPERFARQLEVLAARPDATLVGTLSEGIDSAGRRVRPRDRWRVLRRSLFPPFPHGSAMFRRSAFEAAGGYRAACAGWEDHDLFLRLAGRGRALILADALYSYRYHVETSTLLSPVSPIRGGEHLQRLCLAERRAGRDYAHLLDAAASQPGGGGPSGAGARGRVPLNGGGGESSLRALRVAGALRLWAGHDPNVLGPMLRRVCAEPGALSPAALVWAVCAGVSPAGVRASMRCWIRGRDLLAGLRLGGGGGVYEWRLE